MTRAGSAALLVLVLLVPARAVAQDVPVRSVRLGQRSGQLVASFELGELFDARVRRKLRNGMANQIVARAYVYRDGGGSSVGLGAQTCKVVFDLWEEVYTVVVAAPGSERRVRVTRVEDVVSACGRIERLPVARLARLEASRRYRLAVLAEVNPISQRTLEAIRRWLAHPGGTSESERAGLFGSFASIFVNRRIGAAEKTLRFQSQRFRVALE
ncbi:MAG: DUF4390 domain-containing protein [Deltaproteobacteria bacterium]|nr:DUF4390 domain-containing protein [Deltaproteobacteria bacterium]